MILAGIDEAGLGPNVGPLITACAAFRTPGDWLPGTPWEKLDVVCTRDWRKTDARLGVDDSKALRGRGGTDALEKTYAAFRLAVAGGAPDIAVSTAHNNVTGWCASGWQVLSEPEPHPCYSGAIEPITLHCTREEAEAAGAELASALAANGAEAVRLDVGCLYEPAMNTRFRIGLNKNHILLMETGTRIVTLADAFPDEPVLLVVDKQGGRNDYLPFLTALFPGAWIETITEGRLESVYRVRRGGGVMELRFAAKGDANSFATAVASIAAKYTRERMMNELNEWFGARLRKLKGTAGYPEDAKRWRRAVERRKSADAVMLEKVWRIK